MRLLGLVLVAVGALTMGVNGFGAAPGSPTEVGVVPVNAPAVGGIAVVIGLLLLAGGGRRD
jgi:hypothetical protein